MSYRPLRNNCAFRMRNIYHIVVFLTSWLATQAVKPRYLGRIATDNPGFTNFFEHANPSAATERYSLIFSSFLPVPFVEEYTRIIPYVGKSLTDLNSTDIRELSNKPTWPREPSQVPSECVRWSHIVRPVFLKSLYNFLMQIINFIK